MHMYNFCWLKYYLANFWSHSPPPKKNKQLFELKWLWKFTFLQFHMEAENQALEKEIPNCWCVEVCVCGHS